MRAIAAHEFISILCGATFGCPSASLAQAWNNSSPAVFALRADPSLAKPIDELLERIAAPEPAQVVRDTSGSWVRDDCAGRPPVAPRPPPNAGSRLPTKTLALPPCLRVRRDVRTTVRPGDTWDALVARLGLPPKATDRLKVQPQADLLGPSIGQRLSGALSNLNPFRRGPPTGAVAVASEVAGWTHVQLNLASGVTTQAAFSGAIASALGCPSPGNPKSADACLSAKQVEIISVRQLTPSPSRVLGDPAASGATSLPLDDEGTANLNADQFDGRMRPPRAMIAGHLTVPREEADSAPAMERMLRPTESSALMLNLSLSDVEGGHLAAAAMAAPPMEPAPSLAAPVAPPTSTVGTSKVADGQWPYDRDRILKLIAAARGDPLVKSTIVGVMDVGLADTSGAPLPAEVLAPDPSGDDGNEPAPRGVAMCPSLDAATLQALAARDDEAFSHGAVTASLVAALDLHASNPADALLPRVLFYSVYGPPCPPTDTPSFDNLAMERAFDHLALTATVVNGSSIDPTFESLITKRMTDELSRGQVILVTSAGNYDDDLDKETVGFCPACVRIPGNDGHDDGAAARTIVVGAASWALARAEHSNFGANTVQIYAPGKPTGALDILGNDAGAFNEATTSYAAPYVARAIALLESLGGLSPDQAAHRVLLSVWPFYGDDGKLVTDSAGHETGVLDLTKAAAVRTYAVEAIENQPDGRPARRTYVGDIVGGLSTVNKQLCPQQVIQEDRWQALRLTPIDDTHTKVTAFSRRPQHASFPPPYYTQDYYCQPAGTIHINDLVLGDVPISLSKVTLVLAPLRGR